jgi:oxygen-independent coproporphyrinogen-3 oxidase
MKKHQGVFQPEELPGPAERLELLESSIQRLLAAGYVHVGLDHFALKDDELCHARGAGTLRRNFMGYTTCADSDVLAFGPSAISEIRGTFVQNARGVHEWAGRLEQGHLAAVRGHRPSREDLARSALIMQLFCSLETDLDALRARFPGTLQDVEAEDRDLGRLERDGLIVRRGNQVRVTSRGQLLLRSVAAPFDVYHRADARLHAPAV